MKKYILILVILCLNFFYSVSQTFNAGARVGLTTSQIDGDSFAGFNKYGGVAGIHVNNYFGMKDLRFQFEMNLMQKGSRKPKGQIIIYNLGYVEMPLICVYQHKGLEFEGGLTYGRILWDKATWDGGSYTENMGRLSINKSEVGMLLGLSYPLGEKTSFNTRAQYSLLPISNSVKLVRNWGLKGGSYNFVIAFSCAYSFNEK